MKTSTLSVMAVLLAASTAHADHRALSVDVSGAWSAGTVAALQTAQPQATLSLGPAVLVGARYGLTNSFELTATGLFEPPVTVAHNGVTLVTDSGSFAGTFVHTTMRAGGMVGARAVFGMTWRFHVGLEVGWSQRFYSGLKMYDDSNPDGAIDYGLTLHDTTQGQLLVSPVVGLEWSAGDHWSLSVLPRAQVLLGGPKLTWTVMVPLQFSWSWYL